MNFLKSHRKQVTLLLVSVAMILIPLFIYSCGDYADYFLNPALDKNAEVMVSHATLNDWVTNGTGPDGMVILHVGTPGSYNNPGHILGALYVDQGADLRTTRNDGVSDTGAQVGTSSQVDAMLQRTGIHAGSTVVITAKDMKQAGLLYFNLRYWGFPKRKLRVLSGTTGTYNTDFPSGVSGALTTTPTAEPTASTFTVCELSQKTSVDAVRAPLEEMIAVAKDSDPNTIPFDVRTTAEFDGTNTRKDVEFVGRIKGALHQWFVELMTVTTTEGAASSSQFRAKADIEADLKALGFDSTKTAYIYCQNGTRTGVTFIAFDAILNWPIKVYDGSWVEWGNMTDDKNAAVIKMAANSPWRTDCGATGASACIGDLDANPVSEAVDYTVILDKVDTTSFPDIPGGVPGEDGLSDKFTANSFAFNANQVNEDDKLCGGATDTGGGGGY